eukprot:CAMPEP_0204612940 /NCGR_PEP_ID=MMETSP0717-20131115/983_1 /ASSEMBLY_ACC=CAM_ASM_000666 /TAXON_ID=230516 /ORGANISM="Chaetoceros curvisetus" /LENGTH=318 /DNA_ID=CAMNT_0051625207 /DNA_START=101 /DNA_END=1058 /DNA_ORIENTATION=+
MLVGYSLSPGGLLFPWHIGTLACLSSNGALTDSNPLAGSSAGAIAVTSHGAKVSPEQAIEATVRMSDTCQSEYGSARGNLLPLLKKELNEILDDDVHRVLNEREGFVGVAYKEIFPVNRPVLDTHFDDKDHVIDAVCNSSMFPFFATTGHVASQGKVITENGIYPGLRLMGIFLWTGIDSVAPILKWNMLERQKKKLLNSEDTKVNEENTNNVNLSARKVERTVTISVFPHDAIGITASDSHDQISPEIDANNQTDQLSNLFRLATQCATRKEYYQLYEDGWKDAERWLKEEEQRKWGDTATERRNIIKAVIEAKDLN